MYVYTRIYKLLIGYKSLEVRHSFISLKAAMAPSHRRLLVKCWGPKSTKVGA